MASTNYSISVIVRAVDQATAPLKTAQKAVDELKQSATGLASSLKQASERLSQIGLELMAIGTGVAAPMLAASKAAGDFQNAMNKIQAVAEGTRGEFEQISTRLREIGSTTQYSSNQAAAGLLELSRAGYKTEQSLNAIVPVLNLAAAEELNMGQVAEGLVNILQAFGLGAEESTRAADVLSKTSNETTTSMGELVEAMKFAAPVAASLGISIEETSAYLGALSNAGIRSTMAGTEVRRVIERLIEPTAEAKVALASLSVEVAKTEKGNLDLTETFRRLAESGMTAADAFKIFGTFGATGALVIAKNIDNIAELRQKNDAASGSLQKMVDIMTSGVNPSFQRLINSVNEMLVSFGEPLLGALKRVLDAMSTGVNAVSRFAKEWPLLSAIVGSTAGVVGTIIAAFGGFALAIGGTIFAAVKLGEVWRYVLMVKEQGILTTIRGTAATQAETAAIVANTAAKKLSADIDSLSARNQRIINNTTQDVYTTRDTKPSGLEAAGAAGVTGSTALGVLTFLPYAYEQAKALPTALSGVVASITNIVNAIRLGEAEAKRLDAERQKRSSAKTLGQDELKAATAQYRAMVKAGLDAGRSVSQVHTEVIETIIGAGYSADTNAKLFQALAQDIDTARKKALDLRKEVTRKDATASPFGMTSEDIAKSFNVLAAEANSYYDYQDKLRAIDTEKAKADIRLRTVSQQIAKEQETAIEVSASQNNIKAAENRYNAVKALRAAEYKAQLDAIAKLSEADQPEARRKLDSQTTALRIQNEKQYTEALLKELDAQVKARQQALTDIRNLETQAFTERQSTQAALQQVNQAAMSSYDQLKAKFADAQAKLRDATALMPTMPEKALELAKQAQQAFASLGQATDALQQNLKNNANAFVDAQRNILSVGKEGVAKYQADVESIQINLQRAREMRDEGRLKEAESLYQQVRQQAVSLAQSAPDYMRETAKQQAMGLVQTAGTELSQVNAKQVADARNLNAELSKNIKAAGDIIQGLIQNQIKSHQANIAALDRNTAALKSRISSPDRPAAEKAGLSTARQETAAEGSTDYRTPTGDQGYWHQPRAGDTGQAGDQQGVGAQARGGQHLQFNGQPAYNFSEAELKDGGFSDDDIKRVKQEAKGVVASALGGGGSSQEGQATSTASHDAKMASFELTDEEKAALTFEKRPGPTFRSPTTGRQYEGNAQYWATNQETGGLMATDDPGGGARIEALQESANRKYEEKQRYLAAQYERKKYREEMEQAGMGEVSAAMSDEEVDAQVGQLATERQQKAINESYEANKGRWDEIGKNVHNRYNEFKEKLGISKPQSSWGERASEAVGALREDMQSATSSALAGLSTSAGASDLGIDAAPFEASGQTMFDAASEIMAAAIAFKETAAGITLKVNVGKDGGITTDAFA